MTIERQYIKQFTNESKSSHEDTRIFDIDFSKPEAQQELERYRTEGIQAFKKFLTESKSNSYLCYTIRKANSSYKNDYIYHAEVLFDYGFYKDTYHIRAAARNDSRHSIDTLLKKTSSNSKTIEKYIEKVFDLIIEGAKNRIDVKEESINEVEREKQPCLDALGRDIHIGDMIYTVSSWNGQQKATGGEVLSIYWEDHSIYPKVRMQASGRKVTISSPDKYLILDKRELQ